jgi:cell division protein FtsN
MTTVGTFATRGEAEAARSALTARGIRSEIVADDAGGMYPFPISPAYGVRLMVAAADKNAAAALLTKR